MLVTGATSGVGLATATALAGRSATVIIHGPNPDATAEARAAVGAKHPDAVLHEMAADLSSQDAVRGLAQEVVDRFGRLDVLVNNAAAVFDRWTSNGDGVELTFAVNYLAPYLLTRLLLPALAQSDHGRVVIVASEAHRQAVWDPDDLLSPAGYERFDAYARSKLADLLFNAELATRLDGDSVTVNAAHPGTVRTTLFRPRHLGERIAMPIIALRAVPPGVGAESVVWLATSPEVNGSGGYYHRCERLEPSPQATDEQNALELWKLSAELTDMPVDLG